VVAALVDRREELRRRDRFLVEDFVTDTPSRPSDALPSCPLPGQLHREGIGSRFAFGKVDHFFECESDDHTLEIRGKTREEVVRKVERLASPALAAHFAAFVFFSAVAKQRNEARVRADRYRKALEEIADNPLPAEKGYECAWCNRVLRHHKECPCSIAARALAGEEKP
jgi:hypothetical protein